MRSRKAQRGAFLVLTAIVVAVLVAIAALAIDVGRLYSLRAEMQNAADAASLAAAAELDGNTGAMSRAKTAARDLLTHDSRFADVAALLGDAALPDSAITFFCIIGGANDPASSRTQYCSSSTDSQGRYLATNDAQAHYVQISLTPGQSVPDGYFRMKILFLPALRAVGVGAAKSVSIPAGAIGGHNFYTCNIANVGICDPWEGSGSNFQKSMVIGQGIQLRAKGSLQWSSGNFGFLIPPSGASGAKALGAALASETNNGCGSPNITTDPGGKTNQSTDAVNTRFDIYSGQYTDSTAYPPAPDIINYPSDATQQSIDNRFGNGDWDFNTYWSGAHPGVPAPNAWSNANRPTRWSVYNYELDPTHVPSTVPSTGTPTHTAGSLNRRMITVAVMSCGAMGLAGKSSGTLFPPDGYAKMFLYRRADGPPTPAIWGEYIGWDSVPDANGNFHADVQLYQ